MWIPKVKTFVLGLVFISHSARKYGSQNFTHLTFSIILGRFEKRLRTTVLGKDILQYAN